MRKRPTTDVPSVTSTSKEVFSVSRYLRPKRVEPLLRDNDR